MINIKIILEELSKENQEPQAQIVKHEFADEAGLIERIESIAAAMKGVLTREEALQLQDEVVQDAIIQIDARFAGVANKTDIDELQEAMRAKLKTKMDSLRDFIFDALEGKIEEIKSQMDSARIERIIEENINKKIGELGIQ